MWLVVVKANVCQKLCVHVDYIFPLFDFKSLQIKEENDSASKIYTAEFQLR